MEIMLLLVLLCVNCFSSSLAEDAYNKLRIGPGSRDFEELKEYVTSRESRDFEELKEYVTSRESRDFGELKEYGTSPESRDFEELKKYVAQSITQITTKHANDIQELKNFIHNQGREIHILRSDNKGYAAAIQELKRENEEMKSKSVKVEYDSDLDKNSSGESVSAAITAFELVPKSALNRGSTKLKERGGHQNRIRRSTAETKVAFFASITKHALHLGSNQDIVFDHVVTNIGKAYNQHHGTFVAPVAGTYVFSATLMNAGTATWGQFVVNGAILAKFVLDIKQGVSQTIVVNLATGDYVSVQNAATDRGFHGDRYCTFSGFLLYKDLSVTQIVG